MLLQGVHGKSNRSANRYHNAGVKAMVRAAELRLAFMLPFTAWPVLVWINTWGTAPWGRHSREAMAFVGGDAMHATWACSILALILLVISRPQAKVVVLWLLVALLNEFAMFEFVLASS
jgi:hypothetical protein